MQGISFYKERGLILWELVNKFKEYSQSTYSVIQHIYN